MADSCPVCGHPQELQRAANDDGTELGVFVMQRMLGRELRDGERVHHVNGDGLDARRENLVLCSGNTGEPGAGPKSARKPFRQRPAPGSIGRS